MKLWPENWHLHYMYAEFLERQAQTAEVQEHFLKRLTEAAEYYRKAHKLAIMFGHEDDEPYKWSHTRHLSVVKRHVAIIRKGCPQKEENYYLAKKKEFEYEWWPRLWLGQIRLALGKDQLAFEAYREAADLCQADRNVKYAIVYAADSKYTVKNYIKYLRKRRYCLTCGKLTDGTEPTCGEKTAPEAKACGGILRGKEAEADLKRLRMMSLLPKEKLWAMMSSKFN